jgi:hypothetical protein
MKLRTRPFGPSTVVETFSDVERLEFRDGGLTVVIASSIHDKNMVRGFDILFENPAGFRLLDELDLHRYWQSDGFVRGHYVLEVEAGGWADEEEACAGWSNPKREWLVVTGNACVSVFCASDPAIKETGWMLNR